MVLVGSWGGGGGEDGAVGTGAGVGQVARRAGLTGRQVGRGAVGYVVGCSRCGYRAYPAC